MKLLFTEGKDMDIIKRLERPDKEYTPISFWFLNGDLTHKEIKRQLRDFKAHGVSGVVIHPRLGISRRIGYLSALFFRYIRTAVETADELGMKVVLYDEGMYPSGSACGLVVKDAPELASRGIIITDKPLNGDTVLTETEEGYLVERFSRGTLRGIHFGEDDGEAEAPLSADILNPEAVAKFIELTHEAYFREFGRYFGNTIIGFFTDEPSILGRNADGFRPWTRGFREVFEREGGDIKGLTGLFTGTGNKDTELYDGLILRLEEEVYYGSLSKWCEKHGIALMGHPHQSDDIEVEKYFHIPGQDVVWRMVAPETGGTKGIDSTMAKCSADMARLMGRKRNSNECFGACNRDNIPWYFTGSDMKWYIDWLAVRGVNMFIPHAFYYSIKGARSQERPPDVGPWSIWWPYYRKWADYMSRLSMLMSEAEMILPVAVLVKNRDLLPELVEGLIRDHVGFQYIPMSMWKDLRAENGKLRLRERSYDAVTGIGPVFEGVSGDVKKVKPDIVTKTEQPDLRCAHIISGCREMWFLVNEGERDIVTEASVMTDSPLARYDLFGNVKERISSERKNGISSFSIGLSRNESCLIYTADEDEWESLDGPWTAAASYDNSLFKPVSESSPDQKKIYEAEIGKQDGDTEIVLEADEMTELFINGRFFDVSFWSPHRFRIPAELLGNDVNKLKLIVTGSRANVFGKRKIPYGLYGI